MLRDAVLGIVLRHYLANLPSRESSGRCSVATPPELAGAIFLRQH